MYIISNYHDSEYYSDNRSAITITQDFETPYKSKAQIVSIQPLVSI